MPKVMQFDFVVKLIFVQLVDFQGPSRRASRVGWNAAAGFFSLECPVGWIPMLQHIRKIHEVKRIVHGKDSLSPLLERPWGYLIKNAEAAPLVCGLLRIDGLKERRSGIIQI
jgi:hypothetical protein